jgi:4'-phosphopantetheinyl transferase
MERKRDETAGREWCARAQAPPLAPGDAHVWCISLDEDPDALLQLQSLLSPSERERAGRFRFENLRHRFIVGHASLRLLLSQYAGCAPRDLEFTFGAHGKPAIAKPRLEPELHFNLSHSQNLALLAVSRIGLTGVDLEQIRPMRDARELVARFFSPRESREFAQLSESEQPRAFFNLWTRKEALLKATGEGIAYSLNKVEVTFRPGEPARLLALPENANGGEWFLKHLEPASGFVGAVIVQAAPRRLGTFSFRRAGLETNE